MKTLFMTLIIALCTAPSLAQAATLKEPENSLKAPDDPGMKTPVDPGAVVEPPRTGTEEIVKKPKQVDPEIDDATSDIDRKTRKKLEEKEKKKQK